MSRGGKKFGNTVYKELTAKGYVIFPVHPEAQTIDGVRCWQSLRSLPETVGGLVVVVPPAQTEKVVEEAMQVGIRRVWMQRGSESSKAVRYCEEKGMMVVHGECILMFAEPTAFFHRAHRWLWRLLGKLPR
jgi:hypothetical protein